MAEINNKGNNPQGADRFG